ncbi:uncharacterized protein LOC119986836 [Tripterygium wilfordii]|uniref:uncharacterized protein LOC119986836 n=1 Tax=Tripterygium wilfordii TaxID=458696 RepID=UPI0018F82227|nr:uncharacterized protein LOC119986836 [Tripterygium wilfordii]
MGFELSSMSPYDNLIFSLLGGNMMAERVTILLLFVCCSSKLYIGIGAYELSKEEDLELEEQLKLLNKPAITTIETIYGEKYDCVDFYKQPAFDHPALKNHNFHPEMIPNSYPEGRMYKNSSTNNRSKSLWVNGEGCPVGTVPIKKTTKEDLINAKLASKIYDKQYNPLTQQEPGTHYAILHTNYGTGRKFNGGGMETATYNPRPVTGSQYSSSQVKIVNGRDSIEVGWTVNPTLYKDDRVRLFIYTNAGASRCFNTHCPGFIIVRTDVPIDQILDPISQRGKKLYGQTLLIYRDSPSGNWWLELDRAQTKVGFWPKSIFTGLTDLATYIEWGGKVYGPHLAPSPPMGTGFKLEVNLFWDAFCRLIVTVNETYQIIDATETSTYADIEQYQAIDMGFYNPTYRHLMLYGGPGGYIGK